MFQKLVEARQPHPLTEDLITLPLFLLRPHPIITIIPHQHHVLRQLRSHRLGQEPLENLRGDLLEIDLFPRRFCECRGDLRGGDPFGDGLDFETVDFFGVGEAGGEEAGDEFAGVAGGVEEGHVRGVGVPRFDDGEVAALGLRVEVGLWGGVGCQLRVSDGVIGGRESRLIRLEGSDSSEMNRRTM